MEPGLLDFLEPLLDLDLDFLFSLICVFLEPLDFLEPLLDLDLDFLFSFGPTYWHFFVGLLDLDLDRDFDLDLPFSVTTDFPPLPFLLLDLDRDLDLDFPFSLT